jgi:hypothetical protein
VTESGDGDPLPGTSIDVGETITIWPEGRLSNKIYRAEGNVVWDDADPSAVFPFIDDAAVSTALAALKDLRRVTPKLLESVLQDKLPAFYKSRTDLARLLVEHGVLNLSNSGYVCLPERFAGLNVATDVRNPRSDV